MEMHQNKAVDPEWHISYIHSLVGAAEPTTAADGHGRRRATPVGRQTPTTVICGVNREN
jgi:hypothetical protein